VSKLVECLAPCAHLADLDLSGSDWLSGPAAALTALRAVRRLNLKGCAGLRGDASDLLSNDYIRLNLLDCNLFTLDHEREIAMLEAAWRGDEAGMREGLYHNLDTNKLLGEDWMQSAALVEASRNGKISAMKLLLASGADTEIVTEDCDTPMIVAVRHNHVDALKLLMAEGADVNKMNYVAF